MHRDCVRGHNIKCMQQKAGHQLEREDPISLSTASLEGILIHECNYSLAIFNCCKPRSVLASPLRQVAPTDQSQRQKTASPHVLAYGSYKGIQKWVEAKNSTLLGEHEDMSIHKIGMTFCMYAAYRESSKVAI